MMKRMLTLTLALSLTLTLAACGGKADPTPTPDAENTTPVTENTTPVELSGVEDGVLTVAMECTYAPYNWTQSDDSNGAVPIVNNPGSYANGYDVTIAKKIAEANGWELEIMAIEWGGLSPALKAGTVDMVIAGQSMTADRMAEVDMAGPYFYATIVCVTKAGSEQDGAIGISDLTGTCTAQTGTIWYDTCLPQIQGAELMPAAETAPAMIMAVESGTVDFICTDMPTAMGACATYGDLVILDFTASDDDFDVSDEEINIGLSVRKGNTTLLDAANKVLSSMTAEDFNTLMNEAIAVQPEI
ncbi:MAG: transporter substrate-binding domain-containing protein [Oscillospiraceae bacterium]|nr:transporter substrate-binding domain-containing protein [Oscillospiraceae bacterium]